VSFHTHGFIFAFVDKKRKEKEKKNNIAHRLGNLSHVDMWFPQLNFMPIWAFALVEVYLESVI